MNVAKILKKCRKARNITQVELAEKSGVSVTTISYAENTRKGITVGVLLLLLNAMDYDVAVVDKRERKIVTVNE